MALLTRKQIINSSDLMFEDVHVPEWGGDVRLSVITGKERSQYQNETLIINGGKVTGMKLENIQSRLLALCIVDENGERLFQTAADVQKLAGKNGAVIETLFKRAQRLNKLEDNAVDDAAENFTQTTNSDSITD